MRDESRYSVAALIAAAVAFTASSASAQLFGTSDLILACDNDVTIHSSYPGGEAPWQCFDQVADTKYLNFGEAGTGVIVEPFYGSAVVQSMQFTTANDAEPRDPATWELYGTNDFVSSEDNSTGDAENWTLIASGDANLPADRMVAGPVYDFSNSTEYTAYKIIFPTVKDSENANSMQIAEIGLYTGSGGSGDQITSLFDLALAVGWEGPQSDHPPGEGPVSAFDGNSSTKYLNFGREYSGFIVARADGQAAVVEQFTITTANDWAERDPTSWELYGTNDPIVDEDNSTGQGENWTLIDSGPVDLPTNRFTVGPVVPVNNTTAYTGYKMLFPTVRAPSDWPGDSLQIGDILIEGSGIVECTADLNNDGLLDFFDVQSFLNYYSGGDLRADFIPDGVLDFFDVQEYLNQYSAGCP